MLLMGMPSPYVLLNLKCPILAHLKKSPNWALHLKCHHTFSSLLTTVLVDLLASMPDRMLVDQFVNPPEEQWTKAPSDEVE